jgi:hypothetical protein
MPTDDRKQPVYSAEQARGGEIILRRKWQRWVFIAGLVGCVVLVLILRVFALVGS